MGFPPEPQHINIDVQLRLIRKTDDGVGDGIWVGGHSQASNFYGLPGNPSPHIRLQGYFISSPSPGTLDPESLLHSENKLGSAFSICLRDKV